MMHDASVTLGERLEWHRLESDEFHRWLGRADHEATAQFAPAGVLSSVVSGLVGRAEINSTSTIWAHASWSAGSPLFCGPLARVFGIRLDQIVDRTFQGVDQNGSEVSRNRHIRRIRPGSSRAGHHDQSGQSRESERAESEPPARRTNINMTALQSAETNRDG
jgi:hypothetical protein